MLNYFDHLFRKEMDQNLTGENEKILVRVYDLADHWSSE